MRPQLAQDLKDICEIFCRRVEAGEVRSIKTYSAMKEVLNRIAQEEC